MSNPTSKQADEEVISTSLMLLSKSNLDAAISYAQYALEKKEMLFDDLNRKFNDLITQFLDMDSSSYEHDRIMERILTNRREYNKTVSIIRELNDFLKEKENSKSR